MRKSLDFSVTECNETGRNKKEAEVLKNQGFRNLKLNSERGIRTLDTAGMNRML